MPCIQVMAFDRAFLEIDETGLIKGGTQRHVVERAMNGVVVANDGAVGDRLGRYFEEYGRGLLGFFNDLVIFGAEEEQQAAADEEYQRQ